MALAALLLGALTSLGAPAGSEALLPMLPPAPVISGWPVPATAGAGAHAAALQNDPHHGQSYWLRPMAGEPSATRLVFVIPQYHRNEQMPIAWTSLGAEISAVQGNIETLVTRLVVAHGLSCIGTEGSALGTIKQSGELEQLAWWNRQIHRSRRIALDELRLEADVAARPLAIITDLLSAALSSHLLYLDGVGAAQARLDTSVALERFGLEDGSVNREAVALLDELKEIEEAMAVLDPETEPAGAGVVGEMWLAEYPSYEREVLLPLAGAFVELDELRRELRADELVEAKTAIQNFLTLARRIATRVIRAEEVSGTIAYYRELERLRAAGEKSGRRLTATQKRRLAQLEERYVRVSARYAEVTRRHRERIAAHKVVTRMARQDGHRHCALVMGAGHEEALVEELVRAAKRDGLEDLAVVVVAPFSFE